MECDRIKTLLSEYIDDILDESARARVEDHLIMCEQCREELRSLLSLVSTLKNVEGVKAPDEFLVSLHERIERRPWFVRMLRACFVPIRFKIPIELATAAIAGIIIFSVWNAQQPPMEIASMRMEYSGKRSEDISAIDSAAKHSLRPEVVTSKEEGRAKLTQTKPIELTIVMQMGTKTKQESVPEVVESAPAGKVPVLTEKKYRPTLKRGFSTADVEPKAEALSGNLNQKEAGAVPQQSEPEHDIIKDIGNLIEAAGGQAILQAQTKHEHDQGVIYVEVPAGKYRQLYENLSKLAEISGESSINAPPEEMIRIRIELTYPE